MLPQVDTLRNGILGTNRNEFAARYCGRRLLFSRPGRSRQQHYDNSGVARPQELRGLLMKVPSCHRPMDSTAHSAVLSPCNLVQVRTIVLTQAVRRCGLVSFCFCSWCCPGCLSV